MRRGELTDNQWQQLQPLLPPEKLKTGRPNLSHRQIINGILVGGRRIPIKWKANPIYPTVR